MFDSSQVLQPVMKGTEAAYTSFFNKAYKNGILDWVFETGNISALPDITKTKSGSNSLNLIVLPLFKNKKPYGIYAVVSPIGALSTKSFESEALKIFLSLVQNKIDLAKQRDILASAYEDIQVLQSKLSNDFKYSAIGELTAGIVEDVMSPVQVILSCANYLEKEYDSIDKKITGVIVSQIRKVETVIKRLAKFVGTQPTGNNLYPCVINEPLRDYYDVVLSSLRYRNYECILDLDENLPPILSKKIYVHQILTNLFGLVINSKVEGGGILVQTKFINNFITLRFIVTDRLDIYSENEDSNKANLNVKMISNIMKRHQGDINIDNNESGGTSIVLNFPIKRNLSK
jgi:signal transduction histidine kinase